MTADFTLWAISSRQVIRAMVVMSSANLMMGLELRVALVARVQERAEHTWCHGGAHCLGSARQFRIQSHKAMLNPRSLTFSHMCSSDPGARGHCGWLGDMALSVDLFGLYVN